MKIEMTSKDGVTLLTAGKYCTENIEVTPTFEVGGGGSAEIITKYAYSGTVVPNTGTIENIYWNTSLNMDEINEILKNANLTYVDFDGLPVYGVYAVFSSDGTTPLSLVGILDASMMVGATAYAGIDLVTNSMLFCTSELLAEQFEGMGSFGWSFNLVVNNGKFSFSGMLLSSLADMGFPNVGAENDKLVSLISATEYVKTVAETLQLSGTYDGATVSCKSNEPIDIKSLLNEKKIPLSIKLYEGGTVVPNSGFVDYVYVNIKLTNEEVVSIIDSFEYEGNEISGAGSIMTWSYMVLRNATDTSPNINFSKYLINGTSVYYIFATFHGNSHMIFDSSNGGWAENVDPVIPIFVEVTDSYQGYNTDKIYPSGTRNDKITGLFSSTPYSFIPKPLESYTIRASSMANSAYEGLRVERIILTGSAVDYISSKAFYNCADLKIVEIPRRIYRINSNAFENCTQLTDIIFTGSTTEWNNLNKEVDWNKNTGIITVHCTDGDITVNPT